MIDKLFDQAEDWNMIVFDKDAQSDYISFRLLELMQDAASKKNKIEVEGEWTHMPPFKINTLYIPFNASYNRMLEKHVLIVESPDINRHAYIKRNGCFPKGKYDIVMAVGQDDKGNNVALLGAF